MPNIFLQYAFKNQIGQWNNNEAQEKENGEEEDTKKLEVFTTGYSKLVTQSIPNRARQGLFLSVILIEFRESIHNNVIKQCLKLWKAYKKCYASLPSLRCWGCVVLMFHCSTPD